MTFMFSLSSLDLGGGCWSKPPDLDISNLEPLDRLGDGFFLLLLLVLLILEEEEVAETDAAVSGSDISANLVPTASSFVLSSARLISATVFVSLLLPLPPADSVDVAATGSDTREEDPEGEMSSAISSQESTVLFSCVPPSSAADWVVVAKLGGGLMSEGRSW